MKASASAVIIPHLNNKNKVKVLYAVLGFFHNLTCYSSASTIINLAKKKKKVDTVSYILSQLGRKCSKVEQMTSVPSHKTSLIADSAREWWVRWGSP